LSRRVKPRPSATTGYSPRPAARTPTGAFATSATLSKQIQQELEKFFIATDELEDEKLEIIGWKGPKIAMKGNQG
jgi:hypothetical protein